MIDSQSVKTTESGGPRGYDAGKKIKGRKRHILTDTEGNLVHAVIHTADIQDRDGAPLLLADRQRFPWLRHVFADGGYAGDKLKDALRRISNGPSRSSSGPITPRASRSCHDAGWSSGPSPGSAQPSPCKGLRKPSPRPAAGCSPPRVQLLTRRIEVYENPDR